MRDAVTARWGPEVAPDGVVDRAAVARQAFAAPDERAWLEGLLWPLVGARVAAVARRARRRADPPPRAAVVETPLLFEAGLEGAYDATIAVIADEDVRAERAAARGHHAVDERSARQLSQEEKAARATYVVANSGTVEQLELALAAVLEKLDARRRDEHPCPIPPPAAARARPRAGPPPAGAPCCAAGSRLAVGAALLVAMAIVLVWPQFHHAVREITLPLRHEDIIRQQAHDKGLDPALIAAVIYAESHFRDGQVSAAGAQGLMQLTPATARYIAHKSGWHAVRRRRPGDAAGQHRLRRLLPALPAAPLRRQRRLRARGLQRRRGQRRPLDLGRQGARRAP